VIQSLALTFGNEKMPDQAVSKPWRHWLRISVLGQIVLVLIIGAALSRLVHGARLQHDAVATIRKAGGSIYYDWQCLFECCGKKSRDPRPRWLADQLGIDYFGHVKYVFATLPTRIRSSSDT
jgi:hypothetical protein